MPENDSVLIVYDGECIYCENFVKMSNLQANLGDVLLINARDELPQKVIDTLQKLSVKLDDGMLVLVGDAVFYGPDAISFLSFYSDKRSIIKRIFYLIFKSKKINHILYPIMKLGRRVTLLLRGRKKLDY